MELQGDICQMIALEFAAQKQSAAMRTYIAFV